MNSLSLVSIEELPVETYIFSDNPKRLPIGINGNPYLALPPYTGNLDILLGSLEDDFPENPYQVYRSFFSELLPKVNVEEMYLADVIFLILALRIKGSGNEICLTYTCSCDEQKKLIGGKNTSPHDLSSITVKAKPTNISETINIKGLALEPLRFRHLPELLGTPAYCLGSFLLKNMVISELPPISVKDSPFLEEIVIAFHSSWGIESILTFDCPCGAEWDTTLPPGDFEGTIMGMLKSHRESSIVGSAERYVNEIASFLMIGEMAPFKSVSEVRDLTLSSRNYWIEKLSQTYKDINNKGKKGV